MENKDNKESQNMLTKITNLKTILPLYYLPFDKIISLLRQNKAFISSYKQNYIELEKEYSKYYNLNTRKKLNSIIPLLESSLQNFASKIKYNSKISLNEQLNNLCYIISYSKIFNNILRHNKILLFKYTIDNNTTYNFNQLISLIMFMDYPKEVIFNINNSSLISSNEFKSLVNEIIKKQNIVSLTVYFNKNYFTFGRNSKKMFVAIKESNPSMDEIFVKFRDITFEIFNDAIKLENLGYNFEDFFNNIDNLENNKLNYNYVNNIEISFCFSEQKKKQLDNCLSFLNNSLINKNINSATKDKLLSLKLQLFTLPNDFNYINIASLISKLHPNNIWLIPYKDIDNKFANEFLKIINDSCDINIINIVNFVGFNKEMLSDFIVKQKNLIDLRICGNMGEDEMELIINKYYDILTNNENNDYKIKKISLNGPIHMNEKWKNLICNFLKLKQIEAFHVDCFFNEREYMRDIAEAFIDNTTMKSFAVRNTCRPPKDYFPEVLKEALYNRKIPRKEVFIKIKLYKLL
jgi:hypothetical protein